MNLSPIQQEFVLHFGEMGSRWGINRTVGQIYALLFLSDEPLHADQIVERLGFSRSNVSIGLRELRAWNLVRLCHKADDRRDHFATPDDLWAIVRTLVAERKKREIDPTLTKLRELEMQTPGSEPDAHAHRRIAELRALIELLAGWYEDMNRMETERLVRLLTLGSRIQGLIGGSGRILPLRRRARRDGPAAASGDREV